jgi:hypothetical protein
MMSDEAVAGLRLSPTADDPDSRPGWRVREIRESEDFDKNTELSGF